MTFKINNRNTRELWAVAHKSRLAEFMRVRLGHFPVNRVTVRPGGGGGGLFVFNDTIEGPRAPAVKPESREGGGGRAERERESLREPRLYEELSITGGPGVGRRHWGILVQQP